MIEPGVWESLPKYEKAELIVTLASHKALLYQEIADYLGLAKATVKQWIQTAKKLGFEFDSGTTADDRGGSKSLTKPAKEEMLWRTENQTPEQLYDRFGESARDYINEYDIKVRPEYLAELRNPMERDGFIPDEIPSTRKQQGKVYILDTKIDIPVKDDDEHRMADGIVQFYRDTYNISDGGWEFVKQDIMLVLQLQRAIEDAEGSNDTKKLKEAVAILKSLTEMRSKWTFPEKKGEDAYKLFRSAIESCYELADQRGWRQSRGCPACGTIITDYLPLFRNVIEFLTTCQKIYSMEFVPAATFRQLKTAAGAALKEYNEHPYLKTELRDIGVPWSMPLVEGLEKLMQRHPDITWDEVAEIAATTLEISPVCFDKSLPWSPINRYVTDESGRVRIVEPED